MSEHCINLSSHESRGFVNKRVSIIWRTVEPQPVLIDPRGRWAFHPDHTPKDDHDWYVSWWKKAYEQPELINRYAPYQPGDVLIGREAWQICEKRELIPGEFTKQSQWNRSMYVVYRATVPSETHPHHPEWGKQVWRSSTTMPSWAARHRHVIKSVSVKQCQDVTEAEASRSCERLEISPATIDGVAVHPMTSTYQDAFKAMIEKRYPKAWDANLWMWRYEVEEAT
jgi:hypothetical protein